MSGRSHLGILCGTVAVSLVAAACASDGDGPTTGSTTGAPPAGTGTTGTGTTGTGTTGTGTSSTGTSSTVETMQPGTGPATTTTSPVRDPVVGDPVVTAVPLPTGFDEPVDLAVRPGDAGLWIVEQEGRVVRYDTAADVTTVAADLTDRTDSDGERGLLGLAFSPDGTLAYLDLTDLDGDTQVLELPVGADGTFDLAAERTLLSVDQPYPNHNGGDLEVGAGGMLFVTLGDGGAGGDPERRASDPTDLLGKLLRIDPRPSGTAPYAIPPDNPFASGELAGVTGAPEVWAWGLRNPWKIAFDPVDGALWIADVGQSAVEEVNRVLPEGGAVAGRGLDFGWSAFEGDTRYNDDVADTGAMVPPVLTYRHEDGRCSISGGAPYRGTEIAGLAPAYVYGDYCSGTLWAFDVATGRNLTLAEGLGAVTAVRTGPDGELYVLAHDGTVYRLAPG